MLEFSLWLIYKILCIRIFWLFFIFHLFIYKNYWSVSHFCTLSIALKCLFIINIIEYKKQKLYKKEKMSCRVNEFFNLFKGSLSSIKYWSNFSHVPIDKFIFSDFFLQKLQIDVIAQKSDSQSKVEVWAQKKIPPKRKDLLAFKWQLPPEYQDGKQCTRP